MTDWMVVTCPHCGKKLNRHSSVTKKGEPKQEITEGAISMCFSCGGWAIFDEILNLRKPTDAELTEIILNPIAMKVKENWLKVMEGKQR